MTPKPESETDLWQTVGGTFLSPVGRWCFWHEVDAARARLTCWRCGTAAYQPNERCDSHMSWTDRLQTEVEHHNAWRKRADEAEAERDRLKAALQDVTIGMDRAGGDRDGMPECPWCQSQGRPEDAEEGYAHDVDCSLMMARAALTPHQGQSTDGETR